MMIKDMYQELLNEKANRDAVGSTYLDNDDFEICDYIISNIPIVDGHGHDGRMLLKHEAIRKSLRRFRLFDEECYFKVNDILMKTNIVNDFPLHMAGIETIFNITKGDDGNKIINVLESRKLHTPRRMYGIDIITLGHEYCHMLKENNLSEHRNGLILGEVIPIFYELLNYEDDLLRIKHINFKLHCLNLEKFYYEYFTTELNDLFNGYSLAKYSSFDMKSIYEYGKCVYGGYLLGFYYAVILYNLYRNDPIKILNCVKDVLNHKTTTLEMLISLNIYKDIKGDIFESEFKNIKKCLVKK